MIKFSESLGMLEVRHPVYKHLAVCSNGWVRNWADGGRWLKGRPNLGYIQICVGNKKYKYLHRIVLEAFEGLPKTGYETNHKDGNKANNGLDNLEWITHKQNCQHRSLLAIKLNYKKPGRKSGFAASEETKIKMSLKKIGVKHPKFKGYWIINGQKFDSLRIAILTTGFSRKKIKAIGIFKPAKRIGKRLLKPLL